MMVARSSVVQTPLECKSTLVFFEISFLTLGFVFCGDFAFEESIGNGGDDIWAMVRNLTLKAY